METPVIAGLVILCVIIFFYASKFLSKATGLIAKVFLIVIVLLAIITVLVYKDLEDLKKDISTKETAFIIRDGTNTYAGVGFKPINKTTFDFDSFKYYDKNELAEIDKNLDQGIDAGVTAERIFILNPKILNKTYTLDLGVNLDQNDIIEAITSNDTYSVLAQKIGPELELDRAYIESAYGKEEVIKGYLSAALIINYFQSADLKLGSQIKSGEIKVVPETISFKVLKYMPFFG